MVNQVNFSSTEQCGQALEGYTALREQGKKAYFSKTSGVIELTEAKTKDKIKWNKVESAALRCLKNNMESEDQIGKLSDILTRAKEIRSLRKKTQENENSSSVLSTSPPLLPEFNIPAPPPPPAPSLTKDQKIKKAQETILYLAKGIEDTEGTLGKLEKENITFLEEQQKLRDPLEKLFSKYLEQTAKIATLENKISAAIVLQEKYKAGIGDLEKRIQDASDESETIQTKDGEFVSKENMKKALVTITGKRDSDPLLTKVNFLQKCKSSIENERKALLTKTLSSFKGTLYLSFSDSTLEYTEINEKIQKNVAEQLIENSLLDKTKRQLEVENRKLNNLNGIKKKKAPSEKDKQNEVQKELKAAVADKFKDALDLEQQNDIISAYI